MPIRTPQEYMDAEPLEVYKMDEKGSLKIGGQCGCCKKRVKDIRGEVVEFPNGCVEFHYAGACVECNMITPFHMRYYHDQKRVVQQVNGKWMESNMVPKTRWSSLKMWFTKMVTNN